jgi:hypothetical protein
MTRFRVEVIGAPVYLLSADQSRVERLGFSTIRWVEAQSVEEAERLARDMVLAELFRKRPRNPTDEPVELTTQVTRLSWLESSMHRDVGKGFTFFPNEVT